MIDGTGYQIFFADTYKLNGLNKEEKYINNICKNMTRSR